MYKLLSIYDMQSDSFKIKSVQRLSDGAYIPISPDNTDYQAYLAWVAKGGVPTPADEVTQ